MFWPAAAAKTRSRAGWGRTRSCSARHTRTHDVVDFATEDWIGISAADWGLSEGNGLISDGTTLVLDPAYFTTARGSSASIQGTAIGHGQFVHNQYNGGTRMVPTPPDAA